MRVLILGCGPAGLMAAHAAAMGNHDVVIVSRARKSFMKGAQYLHKPIPMATRSPGFTVTYELRGTPDSYREKVYGPGYRGTVSPEELSDTHTAYDIREAYDWLWNIYGGYVINDDFDAQKAYKIEKLIEWAKADTVISTVPAPILCKNPDHSFTAEYIWAIGEEHAEDYAIGMNHVICNGEDYPAWYRIANIHGHKSVEWPQFRKPPIPNVFNVTKPVKTTCTCFPDVVRMGRYGKWEKGVLSHTAFYETAALLSQPEQLRLDIRNG